MTEEDIRENIEILKKIALKVGKECDGIRCHVVENNIELREKIIKQNKIIDLMAEQLTAPMNDKEWVKEYYRKKVEECK